MTIVFVSNRTHYMAYFFVHSAAVFLYSSGFSLHTLAISGTRGSSGFGSSRRLHIDKRTLEMVSAGDHSFFKISRQMPPLELMLGW